MILQYDSLCNPVISAKAAKYLAELLDEFCVYNVDYEKLNAINIEGIAPIHMQNRFNFVKFVMQNWRVILNKLDCDDCDFMHIKQYNTALSKQSINKICIIENETVYREVDYVLQMVMQENMKKICITTQSEEFARILHNKLTNNNINYVSNYNFAKTNNLQEQIDSIISMYNNAKLSYDNTIITPANYTWLYDADLYIFSCMTLQQFDNNILDHYWLNNEIRRMLKMPISNEVVKNMQCMISDLAEKNKNIVLTFSKSRGASNFYEQSSIVRKFVEFGVDKQVIKLSVLHDNKQTAENIIPVVANYSISATDVKMLADGNQFAFYVKTFLKLHNNRCKKTEIVRKKCVECINTFIKNYGNNVEQFDVIRQDDYYQYQLCMNIVLWFNKNKHILDSLRVFKKDVQCKYQINIGKSNINIETCVDFVCGSTLVYINTFYKKSTIRGDYYGDSFIPCLQCLALQKTCNIQIKQIQIWNISEIGDPPVNIVDVQISDTFLQKFLEKLTNLFSENLAEGCVLRHDDVRRYAQYEGTLK